MAIRIWTGTIGSTALFAVALTGFIGGAGREAFASAGCSAWNAVRMREVRAHSTAVIVEVGSAWTVGDMLHINGVASAGTQEQITSRGKPVVSGAGGAIAYTITSGDVSTPFGYFLYNFSAKDISYSFSCEPASPTGR